jgi:polar amino acid transport system substrate-binding protein
MVEATWRKAGSLAVAGVLLAVGVGGQPQAGDLAKVKARGTLFLLCFPHQDSEFVRVNLSRGPMKQLGTADDFEGFDIDLMAAFATSLGVVLQVRPVSKPSYDEIIPDLVEGQGDVIASSFSITPARLKKIDFSLPYLDVAELVIARKGAPITRAEDLKGKRAVTVRGASQTERLHNLGLSDKDLVQVDFTRDKYEAVAQGDADFTVVDEGNSTAGVLAEFPNLKSVFKLGIGSQYAVAVRKGSDLKPALDAFISRIRASGELAALVRRWRPQTN